ncbi:MAG: TonB family protein [Terracidiphilus sp.]|jgi:TonB family protein
MASPEKIAPSLPETLPADFSEWDSEGSLTAKPVNPREEWEAWLDSHSFTETPKGLGQSVDRDAALASLVDRPRVSGSTSSAPVFVKQQQDFSDGDSEASPTAKPVNSRDEWGAWIAAHSFGKTPKPLGQSAERKAILLPVVDKPRVSGSASSAPVLVNQQELTGEPADGSSSRASQGLEASYTTNEVPVAPGLPNVAMVDGMSNSPQPKATSRRKGHGALIQLFPSMNIEVKGEQKTAKKKWMIVAAVSTCWILLSLILMIPLFHHGTKSVAKQSVQPLPEATHTQLETHTPNPPISEPLTQEKPSATTEKQQATDNQPANAEDRVKSPQVPTKMQTKMMDDQLTAPTQIPQGIEKQVAENAPPPASFGTDGADGLGGSSANVGAFSGHAQPAVNVVPSKPLSISSGVAAGMLIHETQPVYPPIAKAAQVSGTVVLHATISKNGTIKDLHVVNGPAMLQQAAIDAVRSWRYKPYRLSNEPLEVETTINVVFNFK